MTETDKKNVEFVTQCFTKISEAVNIDESLNDYFTDDVTWETHAPTDIPIGGVFRGIEGVRNFIRNFRETYHVESDTIIHVAAQDDYVYIFGNERVLITPSKRVHERPYCMVVRFHDGKICELHGFTDSAALAEAYSNN